MECRIDPKVLEMVRRFVTDILSKAKDEAVQNLKIKQKEAINNNNTIYSNIKVCKMCFSPLQELPSANLIFSRPLSNAHLNLQLELSGGVDYLGNRLVDRVLVHAEVAPNCKLANRQQTLS